MSLLSSISTLPKLSNISDIQLALLACGFRLAPLERGKYNRLIVAGEPWKHTRHRARARILEMGFRVSLADLDQAINELALFGGV